MTLYGGVVVAMYDPKLGESLNIMAESMPEIFAAFGMSNPGVNLLEFVTNYLFGFIMIIIPFVYMLIMVHRLIGRYIDKGSMAYLLASPHTRTQLIMTQLAVLLLGIVILIVYETLLVIIEGQFLFEEVIAIDKFLMLNGGLLAMHMFFASVCYLTACSFNETKLSIGLGGGLGLVFILIQMLSQVSDDIGFLKYFTPLSLFDTQGLIVFDKHAIIGVVILLFLSVVFIVFAICIFKKRDLSL